MRYQLVFSPEAREDLEEIYQFIASGGGKAAAARYIERLEIFCLGFVDSPARGTQRDHLRQGLRTIGFEQRMSIVFHLSGKTMVFDRFLYGGRQLAPILED